MEIVWLNYRTRGKDGKAREAHYTMLVVQETEMEIAGVKTELVSERSASIIRENPAKYSAMSGGEAIEWLKKEAPKAYRQGFRKWKKRQQDHGTGALVLKRYKLGE